MCKFEFLNPAFNFSFFFHVVHAYWISKIRVRVQCMFNFIIYREQEYYTESISLSLSKSPDCLLTLLGQEKNLYVLTTLFMSQNFRSLKHYEKIQIEIQPPPHLFLPPLLSSTPPNLQPLTARCRQNRAYILMNIKSIVSLSLSLLYVHSLAA